MPIVVETGTADPLAVSYITVANADAYHSARGNAAWATYNTTQKEQALVRGAQALDYLYGTRFSGIRVSKDQGLQWPRKQAVTADGYEIADDEIPVKLTFANAEAALVEAASPNSIAVTYTAGIKAKTEEVDVISESVTYASNYTGRKTYGVLDGLVSELLAVGRYQVPVERS